jgi:dihydrodipicolinate synthase/N-acetylneuraminate lyase
MHNSILADRSQFLRSTFPKGVPLLWCPPLTHYDRHGAIDDRRISAHLEHLSPYVGGFLIPGSTGDGWELNPTERRQVLALGLKEAIRLNRHVLVGALHPDANQALALIRDDLKWLESQFAGSDKLHLLTQAHVCGSTICAPKGKGLTQDEIGRGLATVLDLGLPTAIYQLPQVTENEISPELCADLAQRYQNFIFFKDTSGRDAVVLSGKNLAGVFAARGAEGDYAKWLKSAGGGYDGFLLASANCFAAQLSEIISDTSAHRTESTRQLSGRLTAAVSKLLTKGGSLPDGNAFANANKAFDHFFAYGPKANAAEPPRLHAGSSLPREFVRLAGEVLIREELMPSKGYLE